ncbi:MAG: HPF/RaiA family ribosome-associated protein [Acidobacteriota bacterium]
MELPLDITAREISLNERQDALIRQKAVGLEKFYGNITGCRVVIEGPGGRHRTGGPFKVRISLAVPGDELVVDRRVQEDIDTAIRKAFETMKRKLQDYARVRRHEVKTH